MNLSKKGNANEVFVPTYLDPQKLDISHKDWYRLLLYSDLSFMSYQQFKGVLKMERVLTPIARELQFIHGFEKFSREDLEDILRQCDKDLFVNFRDQKISFDQVKARVAER